MASTSPPKKPLGSATASENSSPENSPSSSALGSSWNRTIQWRRGYDVAGDPLLNVELHAIPPGMRRVPQARIPDVARNQNAFVMSRQRKRAVAWMTVHSQDFQTYLEEAALLARDLRDALTAPEREWEKLIEIARQMRDEMEASGKYTAVEQLQIQSCVAILTDPTTRPAEKATACQRIWQMYQDSKEESPGEKAEEEADLKGASTIDLMKRIGAAKQKKVDGAQ